MSSTFQNTEFARPFNDLTKYIPQALRNEMNVSLMDNLFNRFMTHDESVPMFGYVGLKPASPDDRIKRLPQPNVEREVNTIVPVMSFTTGLNEHTFTVQDLIQKASTLGINDDGRGWLYSQSNNFMPPIDIDKFTNFFKYFWVAKTLPTPPTLAWNPTLDPEYYVMAHPRPSDLDKSNALVATTEPIVLTGSGFEKMDFTMEFTSPTTFKVTANGNLNGWTPITNTEQTLTSFDQPYAFVVQRNGVQKTLVSFNVTREIIYDQNGQDAGHASFDAGDKFTIDVTFLTRLYNVSFEGSFGVKGKLTKVRSLNAYQTVDSVVLEPGDRILVKNNATSANGIYVVSEGAFARAVDFSDDTAVSGARIWVTSGTVNSNKLFVSTAAGAGFQWAQDPGVSVSNTTDWQEGNFWYSTDEMEALGIQRESAIQATRPIIEYSSTLQLNSHVDAQGAPSDSGNAYRQAKTRFDQIPLFDLYRYDGTHAGLVSPTFYYESDLTTTLDTALQIRAATADNGSNDFIFNHGMYDTVTGNLLFAKNTSGQLVSVWHAGYTEATIVDQIFNGESDGELQNLSISNPDTPQQIWTIEAISETGFSVTGSVSVGSPDAVVGVPYDNGHLSFTIPVPSTAFAVGDNFVVRVGNLERPVYTVPTEDGSYAPYNGEDGDKAGAYTISRSFTNNPYLESRKAMLEGVTYSHFRSILAAQVEGLPINYAFGGDIKLWGEQQTLFASLLMQRDMTPISIVDLAERMYEESLNNVRDIYLTQFANYLGTVGSVKTQDAVEALVDWVIGINAKGETATRVLFDSTSPVKGFPITLPQMGVAALTRPVAEYSHELGINVLVHHDGHMSPQEMDSFEFRTLVLGNMIDMMVTRSDGTSTPAIGSHTNIAPVNPYRGELWTRPDGTVLSFGVNYDSTPPEDAKDGELWYSRFNRELRVKNGELWDITTVDPWQPVNFANVLNRLILTIETRLYEGINPNTRQVDFATLEADPTFQDYIKDELYTFATLNNYDPTASGYDPLNAFTWNYSRVKLSESAPVDSTAVPARWFDYMLAHQRTVPGIIPVVDPHTSPWKYFGFEDAQDWWGSLTPAKQAAYTPVYQPTDLPNLVKGGNVVAASTRNIAHSLAGLGAIDGVNVRPGDSVLIVNDVDSTKNGVWTVSNGAWMRSSIPLTADVYFAVTAGGQNRNTNWVVTATVVSPGLDPVVLKQARVWTDEMWADISAAHPTLKLSVNTRTDTLLPPYVGLSSYWSINALTTALVSDPSAAYDFNQNSPVELVWKKAINYKYARVRALVRFDPLMFLGFAWGFNWVDGCGMLLDGYDVAMPGHKRFRLHGENVPLVNDRLDMIADGAGPRVIVTYTAYDSGRRQNFTVTTEDGAVLGYAQEGVPASIGGWSFTIEDHGIPFRMGDRFEIHEDGFGQFIPMSMNLFQGFGQIFTDAMRSLAIDTGDSYSVSAYRDWDVHMGYRAGGMVATDDLRVATESDTLSDSAYSLIFKRNPGARSSWLQGLRITVSKFGGSFIDDATGVHKPSGDASDWAFRIEGYNPRYSKLQYYQLNTVDELVTFHALNGETTDLVWTQPTQKLSENPVTIQLPLVITGVQNVVNFLYGYTMKLDEDGWRFNIGEKNLTDAQTGRTRTVQLEIEKFINACFVGLTPEQGHIINPFLDDVWFDQSTGLVAEFVDTPLFDVKGHPGVFDVLGVKYSRDDLNVIRRNDQTMFGAVGPMFSAHVLIDEYEHLFIFDYYAQSSTKTGLLYDPFSGSRVRTYKFDGRMQQVKNMRPEFGGHYLVGNETRRNLQASTDGMANYYDANHVFEDAKTTRQSLALLGFNEKKYFDDLDVSPISQFNFWRGLIQYKGTNMSVDAYLNNIRYDDAKIDEFWAYKIAEYGDSRQKAFPEMRVNVSDVLTQFAQYQFNAPIVCDDDGENCKADVIGGFINVESSDEERWFSIDDLDQASSFDSEMVGTYRAIRKVGDIVELDFVADGLRVPERDTVTTFEKINSTTLRITAIKDAVDDEGLFIVHGWGYARPRFNPVKLFNYQANELVREIPIWHPATGVYTAQAMEGVNIVSSYNPARFNYSTTIESNNTYDPLRAWGKNEIGRVWLDTTNLHYVPYYDTTIFPTYGERLSRWGMLADFGTVDVYEWVQSTVPPSEFNALAKTQAGNADLDPSTKAAGEVGFPIYYRRERSWNMYPVAWSYSPVPVDVDWGNTPPFASASNTAGLLFANGLAILDGRTFKSLNITPNMHIGGWFNDDVNPYPLSEYIVTDVFTKYVCDENGVSYAGREFPATDQGLTAKVTVYANDANYNADVSGQVLFTKPQIEAYATMTDENGNVVSYNVDIPLKATIIGSGESEQITITSAIGTGQTGPLYGATIDVAENQKWVYEFPRLGITVSIQEASMVSGNFPADVLRNMLADALTNIVTLRDAVVATPIIDAQAEAASLNNDTTEVAGTDRHGWRAWSIPTQAQLNADGVQPVSSWKPYIGPAVGIAGTLRQIQDAVAYAENPWILNNGVEVQRYETEWSMWSVLEDTSVSQTQLSSTSEALTFTFDENLPVNRTSIYINGALQLKSAYTIVGKTVTVLSVKPGSVATVIVRKYDPTAAELAEDAEDDLARQIQYKLDYEYVDQPVRGEDGGITSHLYYFWVKNKSTAATGKRSSILSITQELVEGPDSYLTFQDYQDDGTGTPQYDAITISGLTSVVTKDDTFKLRFTRDFTLRDDPKELDLKNTHTEWTLLRPEQREKIPETLWEKLTDSVSGINVAGDQIPSLRRVLYDERNGTRTQFGFGAEQTLAPAEMLKVTLTDSIVNTDLVLTGDITVPDFIEGLDYDHPEEWFASAASSRNTMITIWNNGSPAQVNEVFFKVLDDILASNYELTDLFKTSRLSAHSIKVIRPSGTQLTT